MRNLFFNLGLSTLFTHELDAVNQSEWHLLYILRDLPEEMAAKTFIVIYVPLFAIIIWLTFNEKSNIRYWARTVFAAFLIIHAVLHKSLENHPL